MIPSGSNSPRPIEGSSKTGRSLKRRALWPTTLLVLALVLHRAYFLTTGDIQWGDWLWISPEALGGYHRLPSAWESMFGLGFVNPQINIGPIYWLMGQLGNLGFSAPMAERLVAFLPMSVLPILSSYWFLRRFGVSKSARVAGALVYGINSYVMTRSIQHIFLVIGAGLAPLVWAAAIDAAREATSSDSQRRTRTRCAFVLGLTFALTLMCDLRMGVLAFVPAAALFFASLRNHSARGKVICVFGGALGLTALMQSYWILPSLLGAGGSPVSTLPDAPFINNFSLLHALALSDPYYSGAMPIWFSRFAVMIPLLALPALAFAGLLVARRRPSVEITVFAVLACVGVFLLKAQNAPLGAVYTWLFDYVPGMRLFRDSSKFAVWVGAGYAVLIALWIDESKRWLRTAHGQGSSPVQLRIFSDSRARAEDFVREHRKRTGAVLGVVLLVGALGFGSRASIADTMGATTDIKAVNPPYAEFEKVVGADKSFGRIMYAPYRDPWATYSEIHPALQPSDLTDISNVVSAVPVGVDPTVIRNVTTSPSLANVLKLSGVRYVVINDDLNSEMWNNTVLPMNVRQVWLTQMHAALDGNPEFKSIPLPGGAKAYVSNAPARMFSAAAGQNVTDLLQSLPVSSHSTGEARYSVDFDRASGLPTVVSMSSFYDKGWNIQAEITDASGKRRSVPTRHVELPGHLNGFLIQGIPGQTHVYAKVLYQPQIFANFGSSLSALSLLVVLAVIIWTSSWRVRRKSAPDATSSITTSDDNSVVDLTETRTPELTR